ncbi:signal peptidase [Streptomyces viridochromogenes]|uniref:Signal peptidase I n=2 Tax=Streptomyces viridochromogenes TaxID=1938 RepID=A0A0J8BQD6_STRVR|nr:signal peptidase [Streptomyces viridochromogenes]KOG07189.1 signal peptidase [Streptomyces viridochromogenes]KOG08290.1 signal peptidase [Streptomyces viridochromogenes]
MRPTYDIGDRIVAERVGADEVERGDLVLYTASERYQGAAVMQRVIGVGGDRIVCCEGRGMAQERITVNGRPVSEPYVKEGVANGGPPYAATVPEGRLFLLGDNRMNSRDSRAFAEDHDGTVPVGAVMGRVTDSYVVPGLLAAATLFGLLLAIAGLVLGITARNIRRRPAAQVALWPQHF